MAIYPTLIDAAYYFAFIMCFIPGPWNGKKMWHPRTRRDASALDRPRTQPPVLLSRPIR